MICVPRSCCAGLFAGPQRCQERWGWRCWWKASQACQNISLKLMNWVLRSWKMKMTNSHKNIINPFLESSTLLIMTFPEIVESKDLLCGRNMCSRQRTCQKKRSTWQTVWNTNFTWKGSSQFPEISQLFWHGICSALEYGQEIARNMNIIHYYLLFW